MSALARDPLPIEGVAGRPVNLAWTVTDVDEGGGMDLADVTEVEVSIRKRADPGDAQPATARRRMSDQQVEIDEEVSQVLAALDAALTADLGPGLFDVQLDLTLSGEAEPTTWRGLLFLLEDL